MHRYTQLHAQKDIHPQAIVTRTLTELRGSGVFSFDLVHAILVSHSLSNHKHNTHAHTPEQIFTFSHTPICPYFLPDGFSLFTLDGINTQRQTHRPWPEPVALTLSLSDLLQNEVALANPDWKYVTCNFSPTLAAKICVFHVADNSLFGCQSLMTRPVTQMSLSHTVPKLCITTVPLVIIIWVPGIGCIQTYNATSVSYQTHFQHVRVLSLLINCVTVVLPV